MVQTRSFDKSMSHLIDAVFVYGTLQRGEVRERCWPRKPLRIEWCTVNGELHDLGEYPALVSGERAIMGELWQFREDDIEVTLQTLDEIEWFGQDGNDLYVREVKSCRSMAGDERQAFVYLYANPSTIATAPIVLPDAEGFCRWTQRPDNATRESARVL